MSKKIDNSPTLSPFKRFCVTIGNLPSSYVDSMSYYECIMWLCKYLKDTVIPAVNENAESVNELINWFNNLDVSEEINDKLDEFAEDGTLQSYVQPYFNEIIEPQIVAQNQIISSQNSRIDSLVSNVSENMENQNTKIYSNENNINVLKGRVDEIAQLPSGSTSGDAELIDIRTAYNGKVYTSAGDSVRGQVSGIYSQIGSKLKLKKPINWYNPNRTVYDKYINKAGEEYDNTDYRYVYVDVNPTDVLRFYRFYDTNNRYGTYQARFICAYDISGNAVTLSGAENALEYTVPSDIVKLAITIKDENTKPLITINNPYKPIGEQTYFDPYYIAETTFNTESDQKNKTNNVLEVSGTNLTNGQSALIPKNNIAKNVNYIFNGTFESFNKLELRRQKDSYVYNKIEIDSDELTISNENDNYSYTFEHGLTITNDITVMVETKPYSETLSTETENYDIRVIIISNGAKYTSQYVTIPAPQSYDDLSAIARNMTFTTYKFNLLSKDLKNNIFIYGDSYITLRNNRWTYYLAEDGKLDNVLLNGYPGENSYRAYLSFSNLKTKGKPKYLIWAMGMNDPDGDNINANWQSYINEVAKYCLNNDIELILATIPNTPVNDNSYKNTFIKQSGYRYIDFADAVQTAEGESTWKDGMLDVDNIHPTVKGAIALYRQVLKDFPEINE